MRVCLQKLPWRGNGGCRLFNTPGLPLLKNAVMLKITTISSLLLFIIQHTAAQTNAAQDIVLIKAARTASNAAIAKHNVAGIVQNITQGFSIVTGRGMHVAGRDSIAAFWQKTFTQMPGVVYVRTPQEIIISKNDTLAWETGKWAATNSYSAGGKYSAQWHKVNGVWKTQAEIFVSLEK
jgi:ketosteroid isomerase-like protein